MGNHRKYETHKPDGEVGSPAVIESFVRWVERYGNGGPYEVLRSFVERAHSPEAAFDDLFRAPKVRRFGRTAKFDLLCMMGNLGMLSVVPDHPHLQGATGPRAGALLLTAGKKEGRLTAEIIEIVRDLQLALDVPAECMEDALCNWQKKKVGFLFADMLKLRSDRAVLNWKRGRFAELAEHANRPDPRLLLSYRLPRIVF